MRKILLLTALMSIALQATPLIQPGALKVKLENAQKVERVPMGNYLGSYNYPSTHRYTISAYVDGFVTEINIKPYAKVKKGQKLFILKSPTLLDLQSDYIATLLEMEFYQKEVKRLKPLAEKGVVASKRFIEAKNQYEKLRTSTAFKRNLLKAYGLSNRQLNRVTREHRAYPILNVLAQESATVSSLNVQVGSFVHQGDTLAKLVDTTECHFEVDLPWQLTTGLKQGDKLYSDNTMMHVFAISPEIDAVSQTRGIDLHEEGGCHARGGASKNITLYNKREAWSVPSSALVNINGKAVIFVAEGKGYRMVEVKLLSQLEGKNFILAPLHPEDRIAVTSVLTLKSVAEELEE